MLVNKLRNRKSNLVGANNEDANGRYKRYLKEGAIILCLLLFYGNIAYQNLKPNNLVLLEQRALIPSTSVTENIKPVSPDAGAKRALIAIQEQKLGVRESSTGCNCGERIDIYTNGLNQQWCAMFVSWVSMEAGSPLKGRDDSVPWRITNARKLAEYLQKNGTWFSREDANRQRIQPRIGDIMVFWRGNFEGNLGHADIVVGVDADKPGHASLIGGNLFNKVSYRENYYYEEHYGFLGFGRPEIIATTTDVVPAKLAPKNRSKSVIDADIPPGDTLENRYKHTVNQLLPNLLRLKSD